MVSQQTWVITFTSDTDSVDYQVDLLEELFLQASSDIEVAQKPGNKYAQGGWTELIATIVTSSAAVAAINAISTWIKSTHGTNIEIKVKDAELKSWNITSKNYESTLRQLLKYTQDNINEK